MELCVNSLSIGSYEEFRWNKEKWYFQENSSGGVSVEIKVQTWYHETLASSILLQI